MPDEALCNNIDTFLSLPEISLLINTIPGCMSRDFLQLEGRSLSLSAVLLNINLQWKCYPVITTSLPPRTGIVCKNNPMFFSLNPRWCISNFWNLHTIPRENTISTPEDLQNFGPDLVKHLSNFRWAAFPSHSADAFRRLKPHFNVLLDLTG